jgi:hypothetical protein
LSTVKEGEQWGQYHHGDTHRPHADQHNPGCNCCRRDRDVADQPEQPSVGGRVERRDAPLEELIADQLRGRPSKHHPTYRSSSNRDQATGSRAASPMTRHDPSRRRREPHPAVRYQQQPGQVVGWPVATAAKWSGPPSVTALPGEIPIGAGHDPGGVLSFAAGVVVRTGPLGSTRSLRPMAHSECAGGRTRPPTLPRNAGDAFGVTDPHPTTPAANPGSERPVVARSLRDRGAAAGTLESQEGRATETVLAPPGKLGATLWPSWSPVVRSAVSAAAPLASLGQLGRSGSSRQQCRRTNVPSRDWRSRHWSRGRTRRDRMEAGQVVPRYDPRSVSWGRNPDQAAR